MSNQPYNEPFRAETAWTDDDDLFVDERSTAFPPDALVTVRFLRDAVKRHRRIWLVLAFAGLLAGLAMPTVLPPAHVSSVRLVLTHREGDDPARAAATDVSLATTHTVAQRAIDQLKLTETPDELLKQYTATALTDRVLEISVSAKTSEQATQLATVLAQTYLRFRREQIAKLDDPLRRDLVTAREKVTEAEAAVRAAGDNPGEPKVPASPQAIRLGTARERLVFIEHELLDEEVQASRMNSSRLLDVAAPVPVSKKRTLAISAGSGLMAGVFLGLGFVVVRALLSDRLWKRQDIARSLASRIRLSTGRPPRLRWWPFPKYLRKSQRQHPEIRLLVQHLEQQITWSKSTTPALAVVSIDDVQACALATASLAVSVAAQGKHVLVADLTGTGVLAGLLGVKTTGTHESHFSEARQRIDVYLPDPDRGPAQGNHLRLNENNRSTGSGDLALDASWDAAGLVLTLSTLTPTLGADHLATWASRAAVVVTAGRSTATKIHATGEMLRLAGMSIDTAVVLNADRTDEGVGVAEAADGPDRDLEMFAR
jgi:capsular polysaccharide biosynthesis protein